MSVDRVKVLQRAASVLARIAVVLAVIALVPFGMGFKLGLRGIQIAGLYLFVSAALAVLIASVLWAIEWAIKNVRIE